MSDFLSNTVGIAGMVLQVLALVLLIRGPLSRYFPALPLPLHLDRRDHRRRLVHYAPYGARDASYFNVYWGGELAAGRSAVLPSDFAYGARPGRQPAEAQGGSASSPSSYLTVLAPPFRPRLKATCSDSGGTRASRSCSTSVRR